jgi:uncharacterized membrane protein YhdT
MPYPTSSAPTQPPPAAASRTRWKLLLILPYLFLCFPRLYARMTPTLFGFPFFYWYQFAWIVLASLLIALVYRKLRY